MTYAGVSETKIGNYIYDVCYFSVNFGKEYVCRIFHKGSTKLVCEKNGKTIRAALLAARKAAKAILLQYWIGAKIVGISRLFDSVCTTK